MSRYDKSALTLRELLALDRSKMALGELYDLDQEILARRQPVATRVAELVADAETRGSTVKVTWNEERTVAECRIYGADNRLHTHSLLTQGKVRENLDVGSDW